MHIPNQAHPRDQLTPKETSSAICLQKLKQLIYHKKNFTKTGEGGVRYIISGACRQAAKDFSRETGRHFNVFIHLQREMARGLLLRFKRNHTFYDFDRM